MKVGGVFVLSIVLVSGCAMFRSSTPDGPSSSWLRDENGVVLNRIPGTESIEIPEGLPSNRVLDAVEMAVAGTNPGEHNNSWVSKWRPELRDPQNRWIRIGLKVRQHYLCVCYRIEGNRLVPDVPTSTNLDQDGIHIHRKVPAWINNLKPLISMQMYGIVNGTNCSGTKTSTRNRKMLAEARQAEAQAVSAEAAASVAADHAQKTVGARFCESCGAKVAAAANFCGDCGKKLKAK